MTREHRLVEGQAYRILELALDLLSQEPQTDPTQRLVALVTQVREWLEHGEIDLALEALEQLANSGHVPRHVKDCLLRVGWKLESSKQSSPAWKARYPHTASWPGGRSIFGARGGPWRITLEIISGSRFAGFHTTSYTVVEKEISRSTGGGVDQALEDAIKEWKDERGPEQLEQLKKGWMGVSGWEARYPHIAGWIERGKRHCIDIKINFVAGTSSMKAWFYDKTSATEVVLVEKRLGHSIEREVLSTLDEAIGDWTSTHRGHRALERTSDEADQ